MRYLLIGFFIFPFWSFSQTSDINENSIVDLENYQNKEIIIIAHNWILKNQKSCVPKAISVTIDLVKIDTCYDKSNNEISADITHSIRDNAFYAELIKMSQDDLMELQTDLSNFKDKDECDESAQPALIIYKYKEKEYTYGLPRYLHCFPKESEHFMLQFEKLIKSIP